MTTTATCKSIVQTILMVSVAIVWASGLSADPAPFPASSPDIHISYNNTWVADEDAAYQSGSGVSLVNLGALPPGADVDALHGLANGDVLFSLESATMLGGTFYRPSDVIRFNGSGWSKEFDGLAAGIPNGVNVDAIAMSGGNLLLSLDVTAKLGAITVNDSDVIAYNGSAFSVFLLASDLGIPPAADVDALHVDDQGRLLVSFETGGVVGGVTFRDEDLLRWQSPNWSLNIEGSAIDSAWGPADLDAWSIVFIDDSLFADGFE